MAKYLEYKKRSTICIAQGALTNSKHPKSFVNGVYPTHLTRSHGCNTWDVDGNKYIDFICSLGVNLIGFEKTVEAVTKRLSSGAVLSLGSELEIEFAEKIQSLFPYIERIKVLKSGSEACAAAVRIARAYTGRHIIVSEGYHGWHDEFTSLTEPANGINKENFQDIVTLKTDGQYPNAAAIIIEPINIDISDARLENLKRIRKWCDDNGTVLIFDETITALRFPHLSVASWCGIRPDLCIMGKALGGGLPLSIVGGKKELMDCDYFVSSTFAGDTLAMASSLSLLSQLKGEGLVDRMWSDGERFLKEFNSINPEIIKIVGYPTRGIFVAKDDETKALFMQLCVKAGILFHPVSWFWHLQHSEEMHDVLEIAKCAIHLISHGEAKLEGSLPVSPLSQRVRT